MVFSYDGVEYEILPFSFYDRNFTNLIFYNEIYNSDKNIPEDFLVTYSVVRVTGGQNEKPAIITHRRKKPAPLTKYFVG